MSVTHEQCTRRLLSQGANAPSNVQFLALVNLPPGLATRVVRRLAEELAGRSPVFLPPSPPFDELPVEALRPHAFMLLKASRCSLGQDSALSLL